MPSSDTGSVARKNEAALSRIADRVTALCRESGGENVVIPSGEYFFFKLWLLSKKKFHKSPNGKGVSWEGAAVEPEDDQFDDVEMEGCP